MGFDTRYIRLWLKSDSLTKMVLTTSFVMDRYTYNVSPRNGLVSTGGEARIFFKNSNAFLQSLVPSKSTFFLNNQ